MAQHFLEPSWTYQEIIQEGFEKDFKQGFEKGMLKGLRISLVSIVVIWFLELTALAQQQAERITSVKLLSEIIDKLLVAKTIEEARQILMEVDQVSNTPNPDS